MGKKTFMLHGVVSVSAYTKVEAETLEEAIVKAEEYSSDVTWAQSPTDEEYHEQWLTHEMDGTVEDIKEA